MRHHPHHLDHLGRLWMDGQFFDSTNYYITVSARHSHLYPIDLAINVMHVLLLFSISRLPLSNFQMRQLGRTALLPVATLTTRNPFLTNLGVSRPPSAFIHFTSISRDYPPAQIITGNYGRSASSILTRLATKKYLHIYPTSWFPAET